MQKLFAFLNLFYISLAACCAAQSKPNILLIVGDDWGLQAGCYGNRVVHTPNVDRLAKAGMRFTRAFVTQASCSPSRSSMLTGLYPHQNGQIGLAPFNAVINKPPPQEPWFRMKNPPPPTLPALLKQSGYRTGVIGKIHVNPENAFQFDSAKVYGENILDTRRGPKLEEMTREFVDSTGGLPFFLMINFCDPHHPHTRDVEGSPKKKVESSEVRPFPFDRPGVTTPLNEIADYYTSVNRMDEMLGIMLKVFEKKALSDNTIIVILGDNGPPFPSAKTSCFEAGLQVPLIIKRPDQKGGKVCEGLVSTVDLMPTLLELTGVTAPNELPGRSLLPWWEKKKPEWRTHLAAEFTAHEPSMYAPQRTIRNDRYKLIISLLGDSALTEGLVFDGKPAKQAFSSAEKLPTVALYDLHQDPWEKINLTDQPEHQETLRKLQQELLAWRQATHDPLLDKRNFQELTKVRHAKSVEYLKRRAR